MKMANPGRQPTPSVGPSEHRGEPMYTKAELHAMYPTIKVKGVNAYVRARRPHEFRNTLTNVEFRRTCDLDGQRYDDPIHRF